MIVKAHQPCDDCGSSDALSLNKNGSTYCHSCKLYTKGDAIAPPEKPVSASQGWDSISTALATGKAVSVPERGLTAPTLSKFGVVLDGGRVLYPYTHANNDPEVIAAKIRYPDKRFQTVGEWADTGLFGQSAFSKGGKYITIVEGEYDALAAYQLMGSKYPVVSIKNGASGALKDCKKAYEWIDSFEQVVICFDGDRAGIDAAASVATLFSGKAKVVKHSDEYKDACDYLIANAYDAFTNAFWRAEKFVPDGIVLSSNLHEAVMQDLAMPFCRYPWDCLNLMFYGMRKGEIVTLTAGTGVGKTTVIKQLEEKIFKETDEKVGILSLEESTTTAALSLMSLSANKLFHLPTKQQMQDHILNDPANISKKPNLADTITIEEKERAYVDILKDDRFVFVEHKGKQDVETVMSRIRYLAKAQNCGVVVLDHVSILVGLAQATGRNTTEAIDHVMHSLRSVVEETNILLLNICHLSKAGQGRESAEEGGRVKLGDMRGSQAIAQLSNIAIALEANRQHDDPEKRNLTYLRSLKNRFSGETGLAGVLKYDSATGRLDEVDDVNMEDSL